MEEVAYFTKVKVAVQQYKYTAFKMLLKQKYRIRYF